MINVNTSCSTTFDAGKVRNDIKEMRGYCAIIAKALNRTQTNLEQLATMLEAGYLNDRAL